MVPVAGPAHPFMALGGNAGDNPSKPCHGDKHRIWEGHHGFAGPLCSLRRSGDQGSQARAQTLGQVVAGASAGLTY
jgi:hypothetical protein